MPTRDMDSSASSAQTPGKLGKVIVQRSNRIKGQPVLEEWPKDGIGSEKPTGHKGMVTKSDNLRSAGKNEWYRQWLIKFSRAILKLCFVLHKST